MPRPEHATRRNAFIEILIGIREWFRRDRVAQTLDMSTSRYGAVGFSRGIDFSHDSTGYNKPFYPVTQYIAAPFEIVSKPRVCPDVSPISERVRRWYDTIEDTMFTVIAEVSAFSDAGEVWVWDVSEKA